MGVAVVVSPVPMEKLLKFSPKKYPGLFDKHGNLNLEEYYHTPEGQKLYSINPMRMNNLYIKDKRTAITDIFWDLCYLNCFYNGDCYISLASSNWYEKNWGNWGTCNFMNLVDIPRVEYFKPWVPWGEEDKFDELLKEFEKKVNLRKKTYYEFKIEGVKE